MIVDIQEYKLKKTGEELAVIVQNLEAASSNIDDNCLLAEMIDEIAQHIALRAKSANDNVEKCHG